LIEHIYPYLILVGSTIGAVLFALWRHARRVSRLNLALIRLNEQLDFDTPTFLRAAWEPLSHAGLRGISWKLDWFGTLVEGQSGKLEGQAIIHEIHSEEVRLKITFYQKSRQGELRYFNESLIETFLLLLRADILIKAGATQAALAQMAKLNLFLQHDMKNIAQFIQFMSDHLQAMPAGSEQQVLNYLRTATPLIRERADRIVRTLKVGQPQNNPLCPYRLRDEIDQLCRLHRLDCEIQGTANILAPEHTLDSVLDNILKNYSDFSQPENLLRPLIQIEISEVGSGIDITFESRHTPQDIPLERLFEPFWSSTSDGMGIGLYQARQLLEMHGGKLEVRKTENGSLQFRASLPGEINRTEPAVL
jgi:signal transduction histidine kinase